MKIPVRVALAVAAAGAALAALLTSAAPASAVSFTYQISETNGSYAVGMNSLTSGPVIEVTKPGRYITFNNTISYNGWAAGTLTTSSGGYLATDGNCEVVIKGSSSDTGTIWALEPTGSHFYIINKACDNSNGAPAGSWRLSGNGIHLDQMYACGWPYNCSGSYALMTLHLV